MSATTTYHVSEIYGTGEHFPVPGPAMFTVETDSPLAALDAYSEREGFAPYSATEMLDDVTQWTPEIASAPFTNTEIMAYTDAAIA